MNPVDIVVAIILLIAIWSGYRAGILRELSGIVGIILGAYVAQHFSQYIIGWLGIRSDNQSVIFVCTLVAVMLAVILLIYIIDKLLCLGGLSLPIRLLGAAASVMKMVLIMALILSIYTHFSDRATTPAVLRESRTYPLISATGGVAFPYLKRAIEMFNLYVPQEIAPPDSTTTSVSDSISTR